MTPVAPPPELEADRPSAGPHFSEWARTYCRHTMQVPGGPKPGSPLVFEPWQDDFWDEALRLRWDEVQQQWVYVYRTVLEVIPRKNSKTTQSSAFALYSGGPWEGEVKPSVLLAAGSREQAGELWGHAVGFINDPQFGSQLLQAAFQVFQTGITCAANNGAIQRVAGDGKLNHSRNPSKVIADELHVWTTPRQLENWRALTTAGGARVAPQVYGLTTAGDDPDGMLAQLMARVKDVCEVTYGAGVWRERVNEHGHTERVFSGLRVYKNERLGILMYEWAVAPGTPLTDLEAFKAANPASWRTPERIALDLEDPTLDEGSKRRLYGNEWVQAKEAWLTEGVWEQLADPEACKFPPGSAVAAACDASLVHDCTAVAWARRLPDARIAIKCRIWSTRREAPAHRTFKGGRIQHRVVGQAIAAELYQDVKRDPLEPPALSTQYALEAIGYDPRYFVEQAEALSMEGYNVVEYTPSAAPYFDAIQWFYNAVHEGGICHDGDPILGAHARAAAGVKTDRGWKLSKLKTTRPIDGLIAAILAAYTAWLVLQEREYVMAVGPGGEQLEVSDADIDAILGVLPCFGCGEYVPANATCPLCGHDNRLDDEEEE